MYELNQLEKYVNDKNLPDKEIELFWYGWKIAISNSLKNSSLDNIIPYQLKLQTTSDILNNYQQHNKINYIINTVQKSIIDHISICIENNIELYNTRILLTHIKRWKKIKLNDYNIYNIDKNPDKFLFLEIYYIVIKDNNIGEKDKKEMIDHIIFNDSEKLLNTAIKLNKDNIITKLSGIMDIYDYINNLFGTNFYPKTKVSKMLKVISKKI